MNFEFLPDERRKKILEDLHQIGKVISADLSVKFNVSDDTIRRDLKELSEAGLLRKVHGGALPINSAMESFRTRENLFGGYKNQIWLKSC